MVDLVAKLGNAFDVNSVGPEGSTLDHMKAAKRWLLSRDKRPFYIDGSPRGATDTDEDRSQLAAYDEAAAALSARGAGWLLGFALGPDGTGGHWQGVDFDDMERNELLPLTAEGCGYAEWSPSGKGQHLISYGRAFTSLGSNGSGIEAYAGGRFFTFTENMIRDGAPLCMAKFVEQALAPRHGAARPATAGNGVQEVTVEPEVVTELRSALNSISAEDYGTWVAMGHALRELGTTGRELWLTWSQQSSKWKPEDARKWDTFKPDGTGYQAVFAEAQRRGWVNPKSKAAQGGRTTDEGAGPVGINLRLAMGDEIETTKLDYLVDLWLPDRHVVGFYGRGESGKSSLLASLAVHISSTSSTLWVSTEEREDFIRTRHTKAGGVRGTLAVVAGSPTKTDKDGRVIASSFNVFEHLKPAIVEAQNRFHEVGAPPLRFVVLDTIVALTKWEKNQNANDDTSVKNLIAFLEGTAQECGVCIAIVGHSNKGKHDEFSDAVMGARAWVDSPRLSFVHAKDYRDEYAFVIRAAKNNLGPKFAVSYRTIPVHTLHKRDWIQGADTVLCTVEVSPEGIQLGMAAAHLWDEATAKPRDDEAGGPRRAGGGRAEKVLECLLKVVAEASGPVGREQIAFHVARQYGDMKIHRSDWAKVDQLLAERDYLMVKAHKRPDAKNATFYSRVTP